MTITGAGSHRRVRWSTSERLRRRASPTVESSTTITLPSPGGTGTVDVTVMTAAGVSLTSSADKFSYVAATGPPAVTGVAPATGPTTGGTTVTITGTNLDGASARQFFGSTQVTSFLLAIRPHRSRSRARGFGHGGRDRDDAVRYVGDSSADQFSYVVAQAPAVTGVAPATGPAQAAPR